MLKISRELFGVFDKGAIAVACERHPRHQLLAVIEAETDRGDGDALAAQFAAQLLKLSGGAWADIRLPIRHEDHAADSIGRNCFTNALPCLADGGVDRSLAAGPDRLNASFHLLEVLEGTCRNDDLHAVIERDDRHTVLRRQSRKSKDRRFLRLFDFCARHGAGPVDHKRDVDRRARRGFLIGKALELDPEIGLIVLACGENGLTWLNRELDALLGVNRGSGETEKKNA